MARTFATNAPPSDQPNSRNSPWEMAKGDNRLWLGLGAVVVAGGAYYYYTQPDDVKPTESKTQKH
jgi:hypothetical protein